MKKTVLIISLLTLPAAVQAGYGTYSASNTSLKATDNPIANPSQNSWPSANQMMDPRNAGGQDSMVNPNYSGFGGVAPYVNGNLSNPGSANRINSSLDTAGTPWNNATPGNSDLGRINSTAGASSARPGSTDVGLVQ